jgi:hypothetical protein
MFLLVEMMWVSAFAPGFALTMLARKGFLPFCLPVRKPISKSIGSEMRDAGQKDAKRCFFTHRV